MNYCKKTLNIIKNRWPELILIVGLAAIMMLLIQRTQAKAPENISSTDFLQLFVAVIFSVFFMILKFGFLRTLIFAPDQPALPMDLLRLGKPFFWRMFFLGFILFIPFILMYTVISSVLPADLSSQSAYAASFLVALLVSAVMVKLIIFLPAIIIVADTRILESFKYLKYIKLTSAKILLLIFVLQVLTDSLLRPFIMPESKNWSSTDFIILACSHLIAQFISMALSVMAVIYVTQTQHINFLPEQTTTPDDTDNLSSDETDRSKM